MEAFVALGVACNILQLVDCGIKLATVFKQIYDTGTSTRNADVFDNSSKMAHLSSQLHERLVALDKCNELTDDEAELQQIAFSCKEISERLLEETGGIRQNGQHRGLRESISATIKTFKNEKVVAGLEKKLQEHRSILQTRLLMNIQFQQQAAVLQQSQQFGDLDSAFQQLVNGLAASHTDVFDALAGLNQTVKSRTDEGRKDVQAQIALIESRAERTRRVDALQKSLWFAESNDRISSLPRSHANTFEWIFDRDRQGPWDCFVTWLEKGEGIYWISGKPGSGKSVLTKYLVDNDKTASCLSEWAEGMPSITIHFFIWKSGVPLQRQKRGLLCSLVRQLLLKSDTFVEQLLARSDLAAKMEVRDWSVEDLAKLMLSFTEAKLAKICIFIDGLDESESVDGDTGMLELLGWLQSLNGVKICASSRPQIEYLISLGGCPRMTLQDLTQQDLRRFVVDQLEAVAHRYLKLRHDDQAVPEDLIKLVLEKADGVFLWVRLAVSTITRGMRRLDDWQILTTRLDKLPSELHDLYTDMWQRDQEDFEDCSEEAAYYFNLALEADDKYISCFEVMIARSDVAQSLLENESSDISPLRLLHECERYEQRIVICSLGLLEIRLSKEEYPRSRTSVHSVALANDGTAAELSTFRNKQIHFIHRTVVEFLHESKTGRRILDRNIQTKLDIPRIRLRALIAAPYCEFPIVDLYNFRELFYDLPDIEKSIDRQIDWINIFENVHARIPTTYKTAVDIDICRNWVDCVMDGRWNWQNRFHRKENIGQVITPPAYAIGWKSDIARSGVVEYFKQLSSGLMQRPRSREFMTCLAFCTASGLRIRENNYIREIQQLRSLDYLANAGADLSARLPITYGFSPLLDPVSFFCMLEHRIHSPSDDERSKLLDALRTVLQHNINFSQRTLCSLYSFSGVNNDVADALEFSMTPANLSTSVLDSPYDYVLLSLNLTALIRIYCQSIQATEQQIRLVLDTRATLQCDLLGLGLEGDLESKSVFKAVSSQKDSEAFYDALDQYSSVGYMLYRTIHELRRAMSTIEAEKCLRVKNVMKEIYGRGREANLSDLMRLHGTWAEDRVMPKDIPHLKPFGDHAADCSKLIYPACR